MIVVNMDSTAFDKFETQFSKRVSDLRVTLSDFSRVSAGDKLSFCCDKFLEKRNLLAQQCETEFFDMDKTVLHF